MAKKRKIYNKKKNFAEKPDKDEILDNFGSTAIEDDEETENYGPDIENHLQRLLPEPKTAQEHIKTEDIFIRKDMGTHWLVIKKDGIRVTVPK